MLAQLEHARNPLAHGIIGQVDNYCLFIAQISVAAVTPMGILLWALLGGRWDCSENTCLEIQDKFLKEAHACWQREP